MNAPEQVKDLPTVAQLDSVSLIQVISQVARDPSIDINKLERLMDMHERLTAREAGCCAGRSKDS